MNYAEIYFELQNLKFAHLSLKFYKNLLHVHSNIFTGTKSDVFAKSLNILQTYQLFITQFLNGKRIYVIVSSLKLTVGPSFMA